MSLSTKGTSNYNKLLAYAKEPKTGYMAYQLAKEAGWAGRKTTFIKDYRTVQVHLIGFDRMRYIRSDFVIGGKYYPASTINMNTRYQTVFRVRGSNTITGEDFENYVTVGHDELMTRGDLSEIGESIASSRSPNMTISQSSPVMGRGLL